MMSDPTAMVSSWCSAELVRWQAKRPDLTETLRFFEQTSDHQPSVFLFQITDGVVSIRRSRFFSPEDVASHTGPIVARALAYERLLQEAVILGKLDFTVTLALDVNDFGLSSADFPVLNFQKPLGSASVLLPDPDFLNLNFYESIDFADPIDYGSKRNSAIFVGSTTGLLPITAESVQSLSLPRLRAGVFFRSTPSVDFLLPNIVQCDSSKTEELIRRLGFGIGQVGWREQFEHKFLVSMDGNGATCSRVVLSLKSHSVLLKYDSPHRLFYFNTMVPWMHFIPIAKDSDVLDVIASETLNIGAFHFIAHEGKKFAQDFLNKNVVTQYTSEILRGLFHAFAGRTAVFGQDGGPNTKVDDTPRTELQPATTTRICAHVAGVGNVWGSADEWIPQLPTTRHVEGLRIDPAGDADLSGMRYHVIYLDGAVTEPVGVREFSGTTGQNRAICGFCITIDANAAQYVSCRYHAAFADGSERGPVTAGEVCASESFSPLTSLRVEMVMLAPPVLAERSS